MYVTGLVRMSTTSNTKISPNTDEETAQQAKEDSSSDEEE
jgi:hypothetical protein